MKKYFYTILAAVAVVASCAKETFTESRPAGDGNAVFSGTILQPNGLTKVSVVDQNEDDNVYITWNQNDKIWIKNNSEAGDNWNHQTYVKDFYAVDNDATTQFSGEVQNFLTEGATYSARYYGECDVWKNYVLSANPDIACTQEINPVSIENMPLSGEEEYPYSGDHYFNFTCQYAILQVKVPSKLEYNSLYVYVNNSDSYTLCVKNTNLLEAEEGKDFVKIFVPVPAADTYSNITLVAKNDDVEVARMATYEYAGNKTTDPASIGLSAHYIYFFDFCNTQTIKDEATTYTLESKNNIDYKVNIAQDFGQEMPLTINATDQATAPANIFINAREYSVESLTIDAPYSHVEIDYGQSVKVTSKTSLNSFVVKEHYMIKEVEVTKGSVVVEGTEEDKANVSKVTIPAEVTDPVKIDVTGVSAEGQDDRVEIVNNSDQENVTVVIEKDDKTAGGESKEYYVTSQNQVTPVEKDIVATIGKTGYETLAKAVEAVKTGETIILIKDVVLESPIETDKTFTLKLNADITPISGWKTNGNTTDALIIIRRGGNITINGTGKISSNGVGNAYAAVKLTNKDEADKGAAVKLTVDGTVTLEGYYYGICGNGSRHNTFITVNGGTIKGSVANDNVGIYHPQDGTLTINGGTIEGSTGIALKGGKLVVNGGTINGNGVKADFKHNGSGWNNTGDALAVEVCDYPGQPLTVEIKGGKFNSDNAEAVASYAQNDSYTPLKGFITGGTFSSDPWKYCAKGYASVPGENGMWKIVNAPKADVVRVHPDPDLSQEIPGTILETLGSNLFYKSESQTSAGIPIPSVKDDRMELADDYNSVFDLANGLNLNPVGNLNGLDVCYIFAAKNGTGAESDGTKGEFDNYYADFVVSLDRDVNTNDIGLWGFYASWGVAMAFPAPQLISAGTEVELLGLLGKDGHSTFTYYDIKDQVKVFPCGAFKLSNDINGATMKVDLRIYDNNDPNHEKYFVIESYEYTFTNETNAVISKEVKSQTELETAITDAKAGDEIAIKTAGTYTLPGVPNNITISGVEGVIFNCAGSGSIASIPNGATFKNVTLDMGQTEYHGFHHAGYIQFKNCTINGYYKTYGNTKFENCVFNQDTYAYCLNAYGDDLDVINCTFNNKGKAFYCYNEGNPAHYTVNFTGCTFNVEYETKAKSQIFVKNNVAGQKYTVNISDCKIGTSNKTVEEFKTLDIDPDLTNGKGDFRLWNIEEGGAKGKYVKVTLNGETVYSYGSLE